MTYAPVRPATSPELTYLRTMGQWSKLFLAIFNPNVIYTAVAVHPGVADRIVQIGFTGGSGTLANVKKDMTMYAGSTPGAYDLGVVRIRKAPIAGTFYIGEESDVNWQTTTYLTVVDDFDIWARHIQTISDTEFRMDYDVTFSDQNTNFDPVPIMGGHRVVKLTGVSVTLAFDFSNSYVIDSTITGYSLTSPDASAWTGVTTATPTLTFNTTGWHAFYLQVTAANGKIYEGVRYVFVYSDADMPATVFQLGDCSIDYDTGGWSFSVTMQDEISLANVPERALCILFAEDHYGATKTSIGQLAGCENILAVGKIAEESITLNPEQSEITLRIQSYHYWLNKVYGFPTGVIQVTGTPTNWAEMQSPTVDKVVHRLLHWGCTATTIMDVYLTNDVRYASELISPTSSLWTQLQELAFASIQARPGVDRFGRLFVEVEPQLVPVASRTWASVMTLTDVDWHGSINMQRVVVTPVGLVNMSGVVVTSVGTGSALFSLTPGHVFKHYGGTEVLDRMLLSTQALSNQLAGLVLGWRNNPFPNNEAPLLNNRMVDCFPRQAVTWAVSAEDNPRGFSFNARFIPRRVELRWDPTTGFLQTFVSLEMEGVENVSADGDIPGAGSGDLSIPPAPPPYPPIPSFPIVLPGDIAEQSVVSKILLHDTTYGLLYTTSFDTSNPQWITVNSGLTTVQYQKINAISITPSGQIYVAFREADYPGHLRPDIFIAYAPYIGGTFTILEDLTSLKVKFPTPTYSEWAVRALAVNSLNGQAAYLIVGKGGGSTAKLYVGSGATWTSGLEISTYSAINYVASLSYGFGAWLLTGPGAAFVRARQWTINPVGTSVISSSDLLLSGMFQHFRAGTTDKVFHNVDGSAGVWYSSTGNGATYSSVYSAALDTDYNTIGPLGANPHVENYQDCDPTGTYLMLDAFTTAHKGKSSDGGATIVALASLPPGNWHFRYAGSIQRWVAAGGTSVRLTQDFGTIWLNREGNYTADFPSGSIDMVRFVG